MKTFLMKLTLLLALGIMVGSFVGCRNYDDDLARQQTEITDLESRVKILETFKTWAEKAVGDFQTKDTELQRQVDGLSAALVTANAAIEALGSNNHQGDIEALENKLNALIAGSTLTVAQIDSRLNALETADYQGQIDALVRSLESAGYQGQIDELKDALATAASAEEVARILDVLEALEGADYQAQIDALQKAFETLVDDHQDQIDQLNTALEALGAGDLTAVLEQIADLEEQFDALTVGDLLTEEDLEVWFETNHGSDVSDLKTALEALIAEKADAEALTSLEETVNALTEAVTALREELAALIVPYIQSIVAIPTEANGSVVVNGMENAGGGMDFTMDFLVTPAGASEVLAEEDIDLLHGILNEVAATRAILAEEAAVVGASADGDVLTVSFSLSADQTALLEAGQLQLALRVSGTEEGDDIVSPFVSLGKGLVEELIESIDPTQFYQDANEVTINSDADALAPAWGVAEIPAPAGIIDIPFSTAVDAEPNDLELLTLALTTADPVTNGLTNPTYTYAFVKQYAWNGTAWEEMSGTAIVTTGGRVIVSPNLLENRVIVSLTISADNLENDFVTCFAVNVPRQKVDLSAATFTAASHSGNVLVNAEYSVDHNDWNGNHFLWDDDDTNAVLTLDFADQLAAQFPTALDATVNYEIVALHNAGGDVVDEEDVNYPTSEVTAGNAIIDRNNFLYGKSNTGHFMVVKATLDATNAIAPVTHFYCFEMENGEPELPVIDDEAIAHLEDLLKGGNEDAKIFIELPAVAENPGRAWNITETAGGGVPSGKDFAESSLVSSYPASGQFTIKEDLESACPGVTFNVEYVGSQFRFNDTGNPTNRNWEPATNNLASISPEGLITPNGTTAQTSVAPPVGDRLVVEVKISVASPVEVELPGADPATRILTYFICVELP
jgi:hypothetical protein